jgi:hypothetical protein
MSIFSSIRDAIFGRQEAISNAGAKRPAATTTTASGTAGRSQVDIAVLLDKLNTEHPENLDWRRSIVDLMKLLKLDSSLKARKELAQELGYSGDMGDSAKMNLWLHQQVMTKLAEHGGVVPDELRN